VAIGNHDRSFDVRGPGLGGSRHPGDEVGRRGAPGRHASLDPPAALCYLKRPRLAATARHVPNILVDFRVSRKPHAAGTPTEADLPVINVSIARRYARALLAVGLEKGRADAVLDELEGLTRAMTESSDLRTLFESPVFSREQRHGVLESLAKKGMVTEPTLSFLRLLVDRERTAHLEQITRIYRDLADEAAGRLRAEVQTSKPLDEAAAGKLGATLEKLTGKKVRLERRVNAALLGGLVAQVGDTVYDGSLKTQLQKIRETALS
jgi:F-type H+-transporting ATPase subunit delta